MGGISSNSLAAVGLCRNPGITRYVLRLSGIPVASQPLHELGGQRLYRVLVSGHRPLRFMKAPERAQWLRHPLGEHRFQPIEPQPDDPETTMVTHLAVRSVYALGMECGEVTIAVQSPHRGSVVDVKPVGKEADASLLFRDASRLAEEHQGERVLIGADPEFALRGEDGRMVLASDFLGKWGTVGCDSTRYREELGMHQHPLVELRPKPADNPAELFQSIYHALLLAREKIADDSVEWLAGGMPFEGYPIGGHIHFSGVPLCFSLLRKLDAYVSLPLLLVEDEGCRRRRPRYGFLGDVRVKSHGGFEYRTPPSWLVTPLVTRGVLSLAKLVATHYAQLQASPHEQLGLLRAYYRGEKELLFSYVRSIWQELAQLPGYQSDRRVLDGYFRYLLSGEQWPAEKDFRYVWQLR